MDAQKITFIENEANDTIKMIYIHLENYQKLYDTPTKQCINIPTKYFQSFYLANNI